MNENNDNEKTQVVNVDNIQNEVANTNNNEGVDNAFWEPKKKSPIGLIIAIVIVAILLLALGYYFLIDTPKHLYMSIFDRAVKESVNTESQNLNYSYKLGLKVSREDPSFKEIAKIIENISYDGTLMTKDNNKFIYAHQHLTYKGKELIDVNLLSKEDKIYFELPKVLDKPIDSSSDEGEYSSYTDLVDEYQNESKNIANGIIKAVKKALDGANYKKEIVKENGKTVKKSTLTIDNKFMQAIYTSLVHDEDYVKSIAKVSEEKETDVIESLNEELRNYEKPDSLKGDYHISIYTTIFKNELVKLETNFDNIMVNMTKENEVYRFEILEDLNLRLKGSITENKNNDTYNGTLSLSIVSEKVDISIDYEVNTNDKNIKPFDESKAVKYSELTEEDSTKITNWISSNEALNNLLTDLGMNEQIEEDL